MIKIGQIVSSFGLKGQVKVAPMTDFLERFEPGARLRLGPDWVTIEKVGEQPNKLILKLSGIDDKTAADALKWAYLEIQEGAAPKLDEDEYMTSDLIGLNVETADGEALGQVAEVQRGAAHDIIVVGEILIPAVKQFVKKVDIDGGKIVVELIPGMRGEDG